jgi:hypothetical protein
MAILKQLSEHHLNAEHYSDLQAAVNAAASASLPLYVPPGTYLINELILPSNLHIYGAGIGKSIIECTKNQNQQVSWTSGEKTAAAFIKNTSYRQDAQPIVDNIHISDLEIKGNKSISAFDPDYEHYHGIGLSGVKNSTVERCYIYDFAGDGVSLGNKRDSEPNSNNHVRNNRFENCLRGGVTVITAQNCQVHHNYFTGEGHTGLHIEAGTATNSKDIDGCYMHHNVMENIQEYPIWGNNSSPHEWFNFEFCDNIVRNCSGIRSFAIECQDATIARNTFFNCDATDYFWDLGGDIQFYGNRHINCTSGYAFMRVKGHYTRDRVDTTIQNNIFDITGADSDNTNFYAIFFGSAGSFDVPRGVKVLDNIFRCQGIHTILGSGPLDSVFRGNRYDSGGVDDPKYIYSSINYAQVSQEIVDSNLIANTTAVVR